MASFWLSHQISLIVFLSVVLVIAISNLIVLRRLRSYPPPPRYPRVSILVPARNEATNIEVCLRSLLTQEYPNYEVIVLDDASEDATPAIILRLQAEFPRLRALKGKPLPVDWLGKHWACQQLGEAAVGEILLFTDADTQHGPQTLLHAVSALFAEGADLLTAIPREETVTWAEKLTIPIIPWSILVFLPLALAYRLRVPTLSSSIGQFMMYRRHAYEAVGGYASVRLDVVDDIAMGRRIKAAGFRWHLADGVRDVRCRMYHNFHEVWEGFTKNVYASLGSSIPVFALVWLWMLIAFLEPVVVLALFLLGVPVPGAFTELAALAVGLSALLWFFSHWRFGFPLYLTALYPVTIALSFTIAMRSIVLATTGRSTWKGRTLARTKPRFW